MHMYSYHANAAAAKSCRTMHAVRVQSRAAEDAMSSTAEPLVCLGAYRCLPLSKARRITKQGWRDALPNVSLRDNFDANFDEPEVRNAMRCSPAHPKELWNVSGAVSDVSELLNGLDWTDQPQSRCALPARLPSQSTHAEKPLAFCAQNGLGA